jgi:predicted molibdopterin-dependent oxidoreductase YjgC
VKKNGVHIEVSWEEAWQTIHDGFMGVIERHGRGSLGNVARHGYTQHL